MERESPGHGSLDVERPTVFCLHFLGGSAREWRFVADRLGDDFRVVAIDLPGFGDAARTPGYTVADMATYVAEIVRSAAPRAWLVCGHSMGAKVAAVLARSAEDGDAGLDGLLGLVLVAGSPPSPEPMDEASRDEMTGWFAGDDATSRAQARGYVAKNAGPSLGADAADRAVDDVLRAEPSAWRAWLTAGSREDWSGRVGVLRTPALIVAGADDENLGPDAQRRLSAPHYANVRSVTFEGAKHLLPLERPDDLAALISEHAASAAAALAPSLARHGAYARLLASDRVSRGTRRVLLERARPDDPDAEPAALDREAFGTLRALLDRIVPQAPDERIDLAARIDAQLAEGAGDGWRFADLPSDADAYRAGLATLDAAARSARGNAFAACDDDARDDLIRRFTSGDAPQAAADGSAPKRLSAAQMVLWLQDVRADAVKLYVAHPATLARMGYGGIANGGDGFPKSGFARVGLGEREPWEPLAETEAAS